MEKAGMHVRLFFKENTTGIIERKIYGDGGTVRYYVDVDINGQVVNVKSDFYSSKTKSLPTGKKVEVDYMVSPKGIESVEIVGENIVLCRDDTNGELRILVGFGILAVIRMKSRWHLKRKQKKLLMRLERYKYEKEIKYYF